MAWLGVIAMDWCEGFMEAVSLRPKEWLRLTESSTHGHIMTPILAHLLDDNGNSVLGIPQEKLDETLAQACSVLRGWVRAFTQDGADSVGEGFDRSVTES